MADPLVLEERFFGHLSAGRLDEAASIFAEDGVFKFPHFPPMKGRRAIRRLFGMINARFESLRWTVQWEALAAEKVVVCRWNVAGKFRTGKSYDNEGVTVLELGEGGEVRSAMDFFHSTDFSD